MAASRRGGVIRGSVACQPVAEMRQSRHDDTHTQELWDGAQDIVECRAAKDLSAVTITEKVFSCLNVPTSAFTF